MPETLWASAVQLARRQGVHRVARCLHLDYYSLKKRMRSGAETAGRDGVGPRDVFKYPQDPLKTRCPIFALSGDFAPALLILRNARRKACLCF